MGRQARIVAALLVLASPTWANKKAFSIHDDLLAFPQFQIHFPNSYILQTQTSSQQDAHSNTPSIVNKRDTESQQTILNDDAHDTTHDKSHAQDEPAVSYEELILEGQRYLCRIPRVENNSLNQTNKPREITEEEEQRELARATNRGIELLSEMEGRCLYYISGWWSYSFCYMNQIKQFHALPSGGAIPNYPPMEDPMTHSYILGRFPQSEDNEGGNNEGGGEGDEGPTKGNTELAELQTRGGSRYLVQYLDGGDQCDLTGKNRKIEVQFHCNPQLTDRIGWIKELTTCSYLMLIYTPRLCNDAAFLPPQEDEVHTVDCQEILMPDEVSEWEEIRDYHLSQKLVESAEAPKYPVVGGIEVGAQRLVGSEGRQIEKGRVASIGEEKADVVAKRENGELKMLSKEELKKFDLDPQKVEELKNRLEKIAAGKDWTLEFFTGATGEQGLRGLINTDDDSETEEKDDKDDKVDTVDKEEGSPEQGQEAGKEHKGDADDEASASGPETEELQEGSQETFKDEL